MISDERKQTISSILCEVEDERIHKQIYNEQINNIDQTNSKNDFVAFISAYNGRAAENCPRNDRQNEDFRTNMIKVAAIAIAAIEAVDAGKC